MTVESLMIQAVTLQTPIGVERNAIGEAFTVYSDTATFMYLEPKASSEELADRNTPITDWDGYGFPDVAFASDCRVVYGSHTFDVMGDPRLFFNPLLGTFDHWEMDLREVDDSAAVVSGEGVDAFATPGVVGGEGGT